MSAGASAPPERLGADALRPQAEASQDESIDQDLVEELRGLFIADRKPVESQVSSSEPCKAAAACRTSSRDHPPHGSTDGNSNWGQCQQSRAHSVQPYTDANQDDSIDPELLEQLRSLFKSDPKSAASQALSSEVCTSSAMSGQPAQRHSIDEHSALMQRRATLLRPAACSQWCAGGVDCGDDLQEEALIPDWQRKVITMPRVPAPKRLPGQEGSLVAPTHLSYSQASGPPRGATVNNGGSREQWSDGRNEESRWSSEDCHWTSDDWRWKGADWR